MSYFEGIVMRKTQYSLIQGRNENISHSSAQFLLAVSDSSLAQVVETFS